MNDERNQNPVAIATDLASKLMAGIAQSRATTQIGAGGKPILRLLRGGNWVFGQGNEEVQQGSRWVMNPLSLAHGWVCWSQAGKMLGEKMASMMEHQPPDPGPVDNTPYKEQRSFDLKCIDGDDADMEVIYKVSSYGGVQATTQLIGVVQRRLTTPYPCPVLVLSSENYMHKIYGLIDKPIFTIVGWSDMNGVLETAHPAVVASNAPINATAPPVQPAPAPAPPPRKRKAPLNTAAADAATLTVAAAPAPAPAPAPQPAPQPAAVHPEPAPTAQAHTGQRRRPGAR